MSVSDANGFLIGIVRDNNDPMQMGRLRVFIPGLDAPYLKNEELQWCNMVSPFFGTVDNLTVGCEDDKIDGVTTYGMWNIPKIGSHVVISILNNDESKRAWFGCIATTYNNTTIPNGKNKGNGKNKVIQGTEENKTIKTTDMGGLTNDKARGPFERNIAQSDINQNEGDSSDGYHTNMDDPKNLESQIYCWKTPGGHFISMSDSNDHCRIRLKTTAGKQIILDDTSERIYISTGKGKSWLEFDEDGHIQIFGESKISVASDKDLCFTAKHNIHMKAGGNIYLETDGSGTSSDKYGPGNIILQAENNITQRAVNKKIKMSAKDGFELLSSSAGYKLTTKSSIHCKSAESIYHTSAGSHHINSGAGIFNSAPTIKMLAGQYTVTATISHDGPVFSGPIFTPSVATGDPIDTASAASTAQSAPELWKTDIKTQMIQPKLEPWTRPAHDKNRNKYWVTLNENTGSPIMPDTIDKKTLVHRGKDY